MSRVEIIRLQPEDWAVFREVRLAALAADAPAFGSTLERELGFDIDTWRDRIGPTRPARWVARLDGAVVGTAGAYVRNERNELVPELIGMWVAPSARGKGVGRQLADEAMAWARRRGFGEIRLMVADGNDAAVAFYERLGFRMNGYSQPMPHADQIEHEMARSVVA